MSEKDDMMTRFFRRLRELDPLDPSDLDQLEADIEADRDGVVRGPDEWFDESADALDIAARSMEIERLVSNTLGTDDFAGYLKGASWFGYSLDGIEDPETLMAVLAFTVWEREKRGETT